MFIWFGGHYIITYRRASCRSIIIPAARRSDLLGLFPPAQIPGPGLTSVRAGVKKDVPKMRQKNEAWDLEAGFDRLLNNRYRGSSSGSPLFPRHFSLPYSLGHFETALGSPSIITRLGLLDLVIRYLKIWNTSQNVSLARRTLIMRFSCYLTIAGALLSLGTGATSPQRRSDAVASHLPSRSTHDIPAHWAWSFFSRLSGARGDLTPRGTTAASYLRRHRIRRRIHP